MKIKFLLLLVLGMSLDLPSSAQGNLLITPKRVVFEGNKQQAELSLMNTGTDTAIFSISFRHYNMTDQGKLTQVVMPDSTQMFADPYIRIFPRQVTLAPHEAQLIILQYRPQVGMLAGEYRSHLWFRDEKNYEPSGLESISPKTNQLSVSLIAIFGITIPIIIRVGLVSVSATLNDLKIESSKDTIQYLNLTINRAGNISVNGKLKVEYIPDKGKSYLVGLMNVGIYTNLNKRNISVKINQKTGMDFKSGKLKVYYMSPDEEKFMIYCEKEIELGK